MQKRVVDFEREFDICLRARFTCIIISTLEEERALKVVKSICEKKNRPLFSWDIGDGFRSLSTNPLHQNLQTTDSLTALNHIDESNNEAVYVLLDFHELWAIPPVKRKLRTLTEKLKYTKKTIVIITNNLSVPAELQNSTVQLDFPLPQLKDLESALEALVRTPGLKIEMSEKDKGELLRAALGLTTSQAQRVFARAIVEDGRLSIDDINLVIEEKKSIIRQSSALEFYRVTENETNVGGLSILKEWLRLRSRAFSEEAKTYGLQVPKGVALIGISGTGKSLTAKMIAGLWHVPLLRLDMGAVFEKWYGESEANIRSALKTAETISPCVLWIDEIEKALSSSGDSDGGTAMRVLGTVLTWMQEKSAPVFVVATANDISKLPPEIFRRGRFDEIFFLDLPTFEERTEIVKVHLTKRNRLVENFNISKLAESADGYVGAEIEQAIVDAMVIAFNQEREFTTEDILIALKRQVPLSVSQRDKIAELQTWLNDGRAQPASQHGVGENERTRLKTQLGFG